MEVRWRKGSGWKGMKGMGEEGKIGERIIIDWVIIELDLFFRNDVIRFLGDYVILFLIEWELIKYGYCFWKDKC